MWGGGGMTSSRGLEPRVLISRNIKVISNFLLCGRADIMKPLLRNVALPSWVTYPQMNHRAAKWMHRRNTLKGKKKHRFLFLVRLCPLFCSFFCFLLILLIICFLHLPLPFFMLLHLFGYLRLLGCDDLKGVRYFKFFLLFDAHLYI